MLKYMWSCIRIDVASCTSTDRILGKELPREERVKRFPPQLWSLWEATASLLTWLETLGTIPRRDAHCAWQYHLTQVRDKNVPWGFLAPWSGSNVPSLAGNTFSSNPQSSQHAHPHKRKKAQCLVSHRRGKGRQRSTHSEKSGEVLPSLGMRSSTWMTSGSQAATMIRMQGPVALPVLGSLEEGPGLDCNSGFWINVEPTSQESSFLPTRHTGHSPEQPSQTCGPRGGRICSHPREWGGRWAVDEGTKKQDRR